MNQHSSLHIEPQAFDLYRRIESIHRTPAVSASNVKDKYIRYYKILQEVCWESTRDVTFSFANLFSRLDYVCKSFRLLQTDKYAIQTLRRNGKAAMNNALAPDLQEYLFDLRALCRFIAAVYGVEIPETLLAELPPVGRPQPKPHHDRVPYLRVSVESWSDDIIYATTDKEDEPFIKIDYARAGKEGDLRYIGTLLRENMPLNLLDVTITDDRTYLPSLIIIHPDYLIDISSLATCFREYGHNALNYFINKIKPKANTAPILMGNLASQLLDDFINEDKNSPVTYASTINKYFATAALEFCTCDIPDTADFHRQAQTQMANIRDMVRDQLSRHVPGFDRRKTLLEASFICEKLGLQGRADMLQKDFKVLIEQKSGKRDEYRHLHKEDHFIQMMLYQGVLRYNFEGEAKDVQPFLLYSKYADGLMRERFVDALFRESLHLRNRIVSNEMRLADGDIPAFIDGLSAEALNEVGTSSKLWLNYQKPQLQEIIDVLKKADPLAQAYFRRFFTFLSKEQVLCKMGGRQDLTHEGFAGLWHTPLADKIEAGNILLGLHIRSKKRSHPSKGYDLIELNIPRQGDDFLPNFRQGDIIILYAYDEHPDVRKHILMKGNITELNTDTVTVILRNGQQNKDIIGNEEETFAIEHDYSDTSTQNSMRGLFAFLSASEERRSLILGTRIPFREENCSLNGEYGRFNDLILKEKRASDYFLLVGPPGTGKTSCALRYMVEEALTDKDTSLLLLSYTNRAVDEICSMLVDSGIAERVPFIRIGNELSCDERFRPYLLKNSFSNGDKLSDIRKRLVNARIFVGTTTAINSRPYLFHLKHFEVAMIDEASQILEPDLTGILSARHGKNNAIDKFILIGDYKQLPAISLQKEEEARVDEPELRAIGLTDCRNSLFERLYRRCAPDFRSVLRKQGRMHPAISEFPDNVFYREENLEAVPLPHQREEMPYPATIVPEDTIDRLLLQRRMLFIPAESPEEEVQHSDKTNRNEARITALLLSRIYRLTQPGFHPGKTVGVIVPYRNQIAMIREEIARYDIPALMEISIDTVERYQGSQRDIILYSFTVRRAGQLNFLTANTFREGDALIDRKLNVAITRARKQLIVTGNPQVLGMAPTFYKLMQHIRFRNGFIEADTAHFCRGEFSIPAYSYGWDLNTDHYPLSEGFATAFEEIIGREAQKSFCLCKKYDAAYREHIGYGRVEIGMLADADRLLLYDFYCLRRHYATARSMLSSVWPQLSPLLCETNGRLLFCDLSPESGATCMALSDCIGTTQYADIAYMGITPQAGLQTVAGRFFQSDAYRHIPCSFYPGLPGVPPEVLRARAKAGETVVFNVSNLFGRIPFAEAKDLVRHINEWIKAFPRNRYVIAYRDDAGTMADVRSYQAFRSLLDKHLLPTDETAPLTGTIYYKGETGNIPETDTFVYEWLVIPSK